MKINLYDFDKTVFPVDSGALFWRYCLCHNLLVWLCLPYQIVLAFLYALRIIKLKTFKEGFFCFVRFIDTGKMAKRFWDKYESKIYPWFLPQNRQGYTVVVSASPQIYLQEICNRLKVDKLICTNMNERSGKIIGQNCKGEEKVRRIEEQLGNVLVENAYSDSIKSDAPILRLAKNQFQIVNGERIKIKL